MLKLIVVCVFVVGASAQVAPPAVQDVSTCTVAWGVCSATCGTGHQIRDCGVDPVSGLSVYEARLCNKHACSADCQKCENTESPMHIADKEDCRIFYDCSKKEGHTKENQKWSTDLRWCPACTNFNQDIGNCDWACCEDCISGALILLNGGLHVATLYNSDPSGYTADTFVVIGEHVTWSYDATNVQMYEGVWSIGPPALNDGFVESAVYFAGNKNGDWSDWGDCFANCSKEDGNKENPTGRRRRHQAWATKPDNWCLEPCACNEQDELCDNPPPCPTYTLPDCPCVLELEFEDDMLDSCWNNSVIQCEGVLGYVDEFCPGPGVRAGKFNGDVLQIDVFNGWFTTSADTAFTVDFCVVAGATDYIMTNGCDDVDESFGIYTSGGNIHVDIVTDLTGPCTVSFACPSAGCCFTASYNGNSLSLFSDCNTVADASMPCTGGIKNNKCPLIIGSNNKAASPNYLVGQLDYVRILKTADPMALRASGCPCLCSP